MCPFLCCFRTILAGQCSSCHRGTRLTSALDAWLGYDSVEWDDYSVIQRVMANDDASPGYDSFEWDGGVLRMCVLA